MSNTTNKPIRRFLHLGQSVALQVRERAARWGLKESEAIHQLIHLGLRVSAENEDEGQPGMRNRVAYCEALLSEILRVQLQVLHHEDEAIHIQASSEAYNAVKDEAKAAIAKGDKELLRRIADRQDALRDTKLMSVRERARVASEQASGQIIARIEKMISARGI
jgi:predicted nucleotidyltransferase